MSNSRTLSNEVAQRLAQQALERQPAAKLAFWPNNNRRPDKKDSHFSGQVTLSTVQLAEVCAKALAEGRTEVSFWADLWHNEPSVGKSGGDRPILSGRARNLVEARSDEDAATNEIAALLKSAAGQ